MWTMLTRGWFSSSSSSLRFSTSKSAWNSQFVFKWLNYFSVSLLPTHTVLNCFRKIQFGYQIGGICNHHLLHFPHMYEMEWREGERLCEFGWLSSLEKESNGIDIKWLSNFWMENRIRLKQINLCVCVCCS